MRSEISSKTLLYSIGFPILLLAIALISLSSCAEDTASISMNIELDADVQAIVTQAQSSGSVLGLRFLFYFSDRKDSAGNILVGLRPGSEVAPAQAGGAPQWETSAGQGFDYLNLESATLQNIPLGYQDATIIVEMLQKRSQDEQYYVVAAYCITQLRGQRLTKELLTSTLSGTTLRLSKGRSCGSCDGGALVSYSDPADECP